MALEVYPKNPLLLKKSIFSATKFKIKLVNRTNQMIAWSIQASDDSVLEATPYVGALNVNSQISVTISYKPNYEAKHNLEEAHFIEGYYLGFKLLVISKFVVRQSEESARMIALGFRTEDIDDGLCHGIERAIYFPQKREALGSGIQETMIIVFGLVLLFFVFAFG